VTTYAVPLYAFGVVLVASGALLGSWWLALLWPGAACCVVATAYMTRSHGIFGKNSGGGLSKVRVVIFLPYLLGAWASWRFRVWLWQETPYHEILPNLFLGRRVGSAEELPPDVRLVVDMTAEFAEPASVRKGRQYRCLPTLDGAPPDCDALLELVELLAGFEDRVYVHCAVGYGRSATVVCAVLIARGLAATPGKALHEVRRLRNGVMLGRRQYRLLAEVLRLREQTSRKSGVLGQEESRGQM
jgi:protein-tyrosine phosphatase